MSHEKIKIGIAGIGMVGSQLMRYFEEIRGYKRGNDLFVYDKNPTRAMRDNLENAHVIFLCLPTPASRKGGACDTSAIDAIMTLFETSKVIVIKSTVPPGTTERLQKTYPQHMILFNPEFLTESRAWEDMIRPDRQVVGFTAASQEHALLVRNLLPQAFFSSPGMLGTYDFIRVNATEAEMGKYASNIFGALKVSYANMLADICEVTEQTFRKDKNPASVRYQHVRSLLAHDSRIGDAWLNVEHNLYRGFGGACFPKDVSAFRAQAKELLANVPRASTARKRFEKLVKFLDAFWEYNEQLLAAQGLTVEDVSVHDREWLEKKLKKRKTSQKKII